MGAIADILIIRFDGIGDAAILAPLIAGLRASGHRLSIVLSERNVDVFAPGVFDAKFAVPWNAWKTRAIRKNFARLIADARALRFDWALIPTEELSAYRLAAACAIPNRRGFANGLEKPLKTLLVHTLCTSVVHRPASLRESMHEARVQYRLAQDLAEHNEPSRDITLLQTLFLEKIPETQDTIALQVTRKWEHIGLRPPALRALARRLSQSHRLRLLAPQSDASLAREIAEGHDIPVELFSELEAWKQAIARSALLITPDTGAAHIAGMLGTPTIDCFPSKDFAVQSARWAPWAAPSRLIELGPNESASIDCITRAAGNLRQSYIPQG